MKKILFNITILLSGTLIYAQNSVPDFTVKDIYGHVHKLYEDYTDQGKYVFLDFFSTGCGPCQTITPQVDSVFKEFGCNYADIAFLGIEAYSDNNFVWYFAETYNMEFPAVSGIDGGGLNVFTLYDIEYTPHHMIVTPDREILIDDLSVESSKDLKDTLLYYNFSMQECSGNDFIFYSIISDSDSVVAEIDYDNEQINIDLPEGTNLTNLKSTFVNAINSSIEIDGEEQISGESVLDFSNGPLVYQITSEKGVIENWTVNVKTVTTVEYLNEHISVRPNPSKGIFTIVLSGLKNKQYSLLITDISGRQIHKAELSSNSININISDKPAGIYMLNIFIENSLISKKLIINK